jgi:putative membrane protein
VSAPERRPAGTTPAAAPGGAPADDATAVRTDATTYLAVERTLLAWVRTGLAMMGFGFVVARFGLFLRELAATAAHTVPRTSGLSLWIGTGLVVSGVLVNVLAAAQHLRDTARLRRGAPLEPFARAGVAAAVALLLAALGVAMVAYLVVFRP